MAEKKPAGLAPDAVKNLIADLEQAQKEYDKDPRRGTRLALLAVFFSYNAWKTAKISW
jgi:hypothetical protein